MPHVLPFLPVYIVSLFSCSMLNARCSMFLMLCPHHYLFRLHSAQLPHRPIDMLCLSCYSQNICINRLAQSEFRRFVVVRAAKTKTNAALFCPILEWSQHDFENSISPFCRDFLHNMFDYYHYILLLLLLYTLSKHSALHFLHLSSQAVAISITTQCKLVWFGACAHAHPHALRKYEYEHLFSE